MFPLVPNLNTPYGTQTMSDNALEPTTPTEIEMLKERAALMGITHSNNIGVDALRKKIEAKMDGKADSTDVDGNAVTEPVVEPAPVTPVAQANPLAGLSAEEVEELVEPDAPVVKLTLSQYLQKEALKLVRIRISSMDPKKQDLPGEFFTVANQYIGNVRKYVPFGEQTDVGYHVPHCIYEFLKSREFLHIQTRTVNGQIQTKTRYVKEFSIEVLPDLTRAEIAALAADQRATGRLDGED